MYLVSEILSQSFFFSVSLWYELLNFGLVISVRLVTLEMIPLMRFKDLQ